LFSIILPKRTTIVGENGEESLIQKEKNGEKKMRIERTEKKPDRPDEVTFLSQAWLGE
jgi:hypothetical protein